MRLGWKKIGLVDKVKKKVRLGQEKFTFYKKTNYRLALFTHYTTNDVCWVVTCRLNTMQWRFTTFYTTLCIPKLKCTDCTYSTLTVIHVKEYVQQCAKLYLTFGFITY